VYQSIIWVYPTSKKKCTHINPPNAVHCDGEYSEPWA